MLLQTRGQVTAAEVALELEISERTARRDLEALGTAGIPVYSQQGRGGGWRLAGGGRTDLTGLTTAEARALFALAGPASGTPAVKAAFRKLLRALPEPLRNDAEAASTRVLVDGAGWDQVLPSRPAPPHLDTVQAAVIDGIVLRLGYVARDHTPSSRLVHPLGLAAKGAVWYLVAGTDAGLRTFRVDRITDVETTGEPVVRPPDFDLEATWRLITDEVEQRRTPVRARALAHGTVVPWCRSVLGTRMQIGPAREDGRVEVELRGHSARSLAAEIAGFGSMLEVLEPDDVRAQLATLARELAAVYE